MSKELIFNSIVNTLCKYKRIVIVSHVNPDGDTLGSSLALYFFAKKLGCEPQVIVPNDYPMFLAWMPGIENVIVFDKNTEQCINIMSKAELFCYLDFNTPSRTGLMHNDLCHFNKTPRLLIDHHIGADFSAFEACLSETEVSSTSELVAQVIKYQGFDDYLDDKIATNLLVGIITDTGSFSHSIYGTTFDICSKLISDTVNYRQIHSNIYDNSSESRLRLLGFLISERMTVLREYRTAYIYATRADLENYNYQVGDTEGVVNYPLSIDSIKMSVLITERQGMIRFSFRSKGDFSVNDLAREHFNGGGHLNAAGGTLTCNLESALQKFLEILPKYKDALNND